jgi:hypothetical protein
MAWPFGFAKSPLFRYTLIYLSRAFGSLPDQILEKAYSYLYAIYIFMPVFEKISTIISIKESHKKAHNCNQNLDPKNESSAAEDLVTEEYLLLQMNLFFYSRWLIFCRR